jgi:hypothetical protein
MKTLIQRLLIFLHSRKKNQFEYFSPQNILKNSSNVLALLPENKELRDEIEFVIRILQKIFKQVTFLIESTLQLEFKTDSLENFIVYSKKEKNFIDLPRKELIKFLQQKNFDLIIDFNLDDSNFHYWITKHLDAKYKLGLYRKNSTLFDNLVMKVNRIDSVRSIYENFLFLLKL